MKAVVDSDVLIDYLQGVPDAKVEIDRYDPPLYSVISWMEVMCGADTDEDRESAEALFKSMKRVELSPEVARKAVEERQRSLAPSRYSEFQHLPSALLHPKHTHIY